MFEYNYKLLAHFNKMANELMNNGIKNISEEEWNNKFTGYYKSIHELCSHIYISDFNWLKRYMSLREFKTLAIKIFERNYNLTEVVFVNINEYVTMRTELDNIIIDFINEITEKDLEKIVKYKNSKGLGFEKRMDGLLIHLFNHETHHRAMISLSLEMMGKANDYNNVLPFVYKDNTEK
ncbi:DinB family protein [Treponema endosymbiont of Eucomonympha sp.]|uniref:DinB family protein n=1 Tax=Treponema endosymbiont of Eucomonympha sp. TaxID=1580831 RepID=UPI00078230C0|nr:DinB family protein [Treponema endosymbiont of Eucomonympha sp.]